VKPSRDLSDLALRNVDLGPLFSPTQNVPRADDTRRANYERVQQALPEMEARVLEVLKHREDLTNNEITVELGIPGQSCRVTRQVMNLRERHLVEKGRVRKCTFSGQTAQAWRAA
jgi:hypothetical protein